MKPDELREALLAAASSSWEGQQAIRAGYVLRVALEAVSAATTEDARRWWAHEARAQARRAARHAVKAMKAVGLWEVEDGPR